MAKRAQDATPVSEFSLTGDQGGKKLFANSG